jgi:hypothetical protein
MSLGTGAIQVLLHIIFLTGGSSLDSNKDHRLTSVWPPLWLVLVRTVRAIDAVSDVGTARLLFDQVRPRHSWPPFA